MAHMRRSEAMTSHGESRMSMPMTCNTDRAMSIMINLWNVGSLPFTFSAI